MAGKKLLLRVGAVLGVGILVAWMEPWAERFEGKTVSSWLKEFREKKEIDQRVVTAFGDKVAPQLERVIANNLHWGKIRYFCEEALELVVPGNVEFEDPEGHEMALAAGSWLSWLAAKGYAPRVDFPPEVDHWMDVWDDSFWAPRGAQLVLTTPDESNAARDAESGKN
jgi:hypothetical protein